MFLDHLSSLIVCERYAIQRRRSSIRIGRLSEVSDLHELHNIINPEGNAVVAGPPKFLGTEDEIDVDGISGVDFAEDEDDSQFVDGCFLINSTE